MLDELHEEEGGVLQLSGADILVPVENFWEICFAAHIEHICAFSLVCLHDDICTFVDVGGGSSDFV